MATVGYQSLERRIRALTFDVRPSDYAFDPDTVLYALNRANVALFSRLNSPPALVASFLTLAANDYDYALGNTYDDAEGLSGFRLVSNGDPIIKKDLATWQAYRDGNPVATGDPTIIAFAEDQAGNLTAYLWPTPWQADTVEATLSSAFAGTDPQFRVDGRDVYDSAAYSIDYPGQTVNGVVYHVAAELLEAAGDEVLAKLGVNRGVAKLYMNQYELAVEAELARNARLRRPGEVAMRNPF